jgi:ferredoxin
MLKNWLMAVLQQDKKVFFQFLEKLRQSYELIAPVKTDLVRFEKINDAREIHLEKNSYFPVKEYFFKKEETLLQFNGKKFITPELKIPERVFFGIRRCDLNGIMHQDKVFIEDVNDPYYIAAREKSFLLGYHCNTAPSPYCFCGSLDLADFYDLMFYDRDNKILVEIGSEKGQFLIKKFRKYFAATGSKIKVEEKIIPGADRLQKKDISQFYDHPSWKKGVEICLSCGACTSLCPTCYCFSINDEISMKNQKISERKRAWSSCQLQEFSEVAGNHIFRKEREERFKHRIYHQLQYFKEKYGIQMCVGCGRCIEGCPTRIDFVEIINDMKPSK